MLVARAGAVSVGLSKFAQDILKSRRVRAFKIHHGWSRGMFNSAEEAAKGINILPPRGTPFIPNERPPGIGSLLDLYRSTPDH